MASTAAAGSARRLGLRHAIVVFGILIGVSAPVRADESAVRLTGEAFVVTQREAAAVDVFQLFTLANEGAVPVEAPVLPVAEGAVRLRVDRLGEGGQPTTLVERLGPGEPPRDPEPLAPGEARSYQAVYRLWAGQWPVPLKRSLPYASHGATVFARPGELEVSGLKVARAGRQESQGVELDVYQVEPGEPADRWQVLVRLAEAVRLPVLAGAQARNPLDAFPGGGRWALGLGVALLGGALLLGRRRLLGPVRRGRSRAGTPADPLAPWVDRLASLDLSFQRRELPEEAYRLQREALVAAFRRGQASPGPAGARAPARPSPPPSVDQR
ncbi:hypothetical protein [Limnochorda pilosa]|uniref:Uncharacterized protein n=1 Tax=Limnochorda pilosa TaxID=1555112 RepID=A0A0K2SG82_LIMPI|nr:hypothetical protein [Limnochorda pilosa]BAS26100.1 hypothetical protein LIP_0243 [Limnochorda pilosa]